MDDRPRNRGDELQGSDSRDSVVLVSRDPAVARRVDEAADGPVEKVDSLEDAARQATHDDLIVYHAPTLGERERERVERFLAETDHRLVVLSPEGAPALVFALARRSGANRLVAIESDLSATNLARRLPHLQLAGSLRPDWNALGLPGGSPLPSLVRRFQLLVEEDPIQNWSVEELADRLGVSRTTLNRAIRPAAGCSVKSLLIALRYQLIDRARRERRLGSEKIAEIFQFSNPEELHRWRSRHRARGERAEDR